MEILKSEIYCLEFAFSTKSAKERYLRKDVLSSHGKACVGMKYISDSSLYGSSCNCTFMFPPECPRTSLKYIRNLPDHSWAQISYCRKWAKKEELTGELAAKVTRKLNRCLFRGRNHTNLTSRAALRSLTKR